MDSASIVDAQSGTIETPQEAIERLRNLELAIATADKHVSACRAVLKDAKTARDEAVRALRAACREAKALPLFEPVKG